MGETTGELGNYYAPHGDPDVRDAKRQATTRKHATSVPTVHLGATTQNGVRLAKGTESRRMKLTDWCVRRFPYFRGATKRGCYRSQPPSWAPLCC